MIANRKDIEFNPEFQRALELMEQTSSNVFVTGRAGTGKSTLLRYFRDNTKKRCVVLAPTGVAAVNIGGQTIHSFFGFRPDITVDKARRKKPARSKSNLYMQLDAIVIDEISMVRADLLDCVEAFLRRHGREPGRPFGGIQLIVIGDLYQLAPVVTSKDRQMFADLYQSPYFFSAEAFSALAPEMVELQKVYRQLQDHTLLEILNAIRNRSITEDHLSLLNQRYDPEPSPPEGAMCVHLATTNAGANAVNAEALGRLEGQPFISQGTITGKFEQRSLPAPIDLELKPGAQVMLTNNDPNGRWVNGTVGVVEAIEEGGYDYDAAIIAQLEDGEEVEVEPYTWETFEYVFSPDTKTVETEEVGSFTQYPLILAWAITIHKSQGKTFDNVIIDFERGTFAHGQAYVALSRCTTLDGITLKQPFKKSHIRLDWDVIRFITDFQYQRADSEMPLEDKLASIEAAIADGRDIEVIYLKSSDQRSQRRLTPIEVGDMAFRKKTFPGLRAYCHLRNDERVFRVDRILEMTTV